MYSCGGVILSSERELMTHFNHQYKDEIKVRASNFFLLFLLLSQIDQSSNTDSIQSVDFNVDLDLGSKSNVDLVPSRT